MHRMQVLIVWIKDEHTLTYILTSPEFIKLIVGDKSLTTYKSSSFLWDLDNLR
jgi:hypothetical protein